MTGDKELRDKRQLTHHIHPACIPSSLRERDPSSLSLERGTDREKEAREGNREGNRWRDIEMDRERVFMHVCGHMYTNVSSIDAKKKKSGTTDITPSAERGGKENMGGGK